MGKLRVWMGFFAVLGLVLTVGLTPAVAQKSGDGGEPGAGCPRVPPEGQQYQYNPPLFTGTLTAEWVGNPPVVRSGILQPGRGERGAVYLTGRIEQIDNPGCYVNIKKLKFREDFLFSDFLQTKPEHVRQACIRADAIGLGNLPPESPCFLNGWYKPSSYFEVIGVTDMIVRLHTQYTANILLMGLNLANLPCPPK